MTSPKSRYVKYDDTELDEESLRIAKQELKETDDNKKKCLDTLKRKLLDREDLNPCLQEDFLLAYLRVAKYDINSAYSRIVKFYEEKWNMPEVFSDYSANSLRIVESARTLYLSPYRAKNHGAILILKRKDYDPAVIPYHLIMRVLAMGTEYLLRHPFNQLCGIHVILDLKCSSWSAWNEYTPSRIKLLARLVQKSLAIRLCSIHVINAPSIYYFLYSIAYPFLSAKMRKRIFLHRSYSSIHSYLEPETLPKEYEGHLQNSELINVFERLYEKEDFFHKLSEYGFTKKKT